MNANSPLLDELASIKAYICAARDIVKDGFMPDIVALEKRMNDLCLAIQAAEQDEQARCLPELASVLKALDGCEQDMRAWHAARSKTGVP